MEPLLRPLADALGLAPATAALLVGLVLGASLAWTLRGRRDAGRPPRPTTMASAPLPFVTRTAPPVPNGPLDDQGRREVEALLDAGQAIDAIKRVRELTGLGLKEAKDYVDAPARSRVRRSRHERRRSRVRVGRRDREVFRVPGRARTRPPYDRADADDRPAPEPRPPLRRHHPPAARG